MAKNERIIAQDLAELKHVIQTQNITKITESCKILSRDIKKYPVKPELVTRLKHMSSYSEMSTSNKSLDEEIKEISIIIDILIKSI
ncbi:MAG: hypothetical protein OEL56_01180 [Nitrosopumilus sp.]|nr:hypothetical protein [Nitrosopumilus sp.]MDH3515275.1 hypothetical protein [Nitrosopumilus sp.]MDH3564423.1 hypothetical protein [Nitrosopumilus sp.]MDH5417582.1 hypothetical protein [Nitrosopumilus sp.]MDH5554367.1 hypothetical protein [Nitrosopumilus sp.]